MSHSSLRHRDASGRRTEVDQANAAQEHFLRPSDGRLALVLVQSCDDATASTQKRGWTSVGKMRLQISPVINLVHWTYSSVMTEGSEEWHYDSSSMLELCFKWIPSCIILMLMLIIPQDLEGTIRNGGNYDPVRYRDWGYSKESRNKAENRQVIDEPLEEAGESTRLLSKRGDLELSTYPDDAQDEPKKFPGVEDIDADFDDLPARQFRPRYLCFITEDHTGKMSVQTKNVEEWLREHGPNADVDFIFLSYTRKQFQVALESDLAKWTVPGTKTLLDQETRIAYAEVARRDRPTLIRYGMEAALSAGKRAFWLDFECIRDVEGKAEANSQSNDVYRISDIVRAAHSLVILLGPHWQSRLDNGEGDSYNADRQKQWFYEWGTRLWTLPEILLSSPEYRVKIYTVGNPTPEWLAKRNFATRTWEDARLVRQLVDHYESSIHLTPLELVSIALECFSIRRTDIFHEGDMSYALMGLLRRRPAVQKSDTGFEAFARLSLANDSNKLLERLICMQPTHPNASWHEIKDAWRVPLWDIEPRCQVAGIVDDGTVTLDGAFGATIQWDSMDQITFFKRPTLKRLLGKILLRGVPAYFISALALTIAGGVFQSQVDQAKNQSVDKRSLATYPSASPSWNPGFSTRSLTADSVYSTDYPSATYTPTLDLSNASMSASKTIALGLLIPGILMLIPSVIILLAAPAMLYDIYRGKFWSTQAHFVGVEGRVDIGKAERHLFGFNHGRLKWSTNGSTLSRHHYEDGECVADPPATGKPPAGQRVFTLIDTYTMTATCFYAERPPVAVIVCGQEGGMQRAVLCSYDWKRQTFARETVIRVKTLVLDRMSRVDRFRFAMKRRPDSDDLNVKKGISDASTLVPGKATNSRNGTSSWQMWKFDLFLLPFMFFISAVLIHDLNWQPTGDSILAHYGGFLVACVGCIPLLRRLELGHIIAVSLLVLAPLRIASVFVNNNGIVNNKGAYAIAVFIGLATAFVLASFIALSDAWYTAKEQALRILLWGFCSILLQNGLYKAGSKLEEEGDSELTQKMFIVAFYIVGFILAGAAYFGIKTPEEMRWISAQERARLANRNKSSNPGTPVKVSQVLRQPQIWLVFAISLLNNLYDATVNNTNAFERLLVNRNDIIVVLEIDFPAVVVALVVGIILLKRPNLHILMIGFVILLGVIANLILGVLLLQWGKFKENESLSFYLDEKIGAPMAGGMLFLITVSKIAKFLIWAVSMSNTRDKISRVTTICLMLTGYGLGGFIGGGFWKTVHHPDDYYRYSLVDVNVSYIDRYAYIAMLIVFFLLQMLVLVLWYLYYWRSNRIIAGNGEYAPASTAQRDTSYDSGLLNEERELPRSQTFRYLT